jgi:hypothetical protein
MKPSLSIKLAQLATRLEELNGLLGAEDAARDLDRYRALTREHAEITPIVALYREWERSGRDLAAAREMFADPQMKSFAEDESKAAKARMEALEEQLQRALLPSDPNDERNVFLEIRAGTGGDESALFAGDLFRMYARFAERNKWQLELISESPGEMGGYKEVIARIIGQGTYSKLKFESAGIVCSGCQRLRRKGAFILPRARWQCSRKPTRLPTSRSILLSFASTPFAHLAPAVSTSTRPIPRCASPICRPGWSSSARMTDRSIATGRRRWRCWRRDCSTASTRSAIGRKRRRARA